MFKKILVPLDGSQLAEAALAPAIRLVQQGKGKLILLHVTSGSANFYSTVDGVPMSNLYSHDFRLDEHYVAGREYLNGLRYGLGRNYPDLLWDVMVEVGDPASVIVDLAREKEVDLIVMSTHGRSGLRRWLLGSVTEKVLCQAPCPVLSIRSEKPIQQILVTLDGSELSETCLPAAFYCAAAFSASVTLLRVYSEKNVPDYSEVQELDMYETGLGERAAQQVAEHTAEYLENIRLRYEGSEVPITTAVRYGSPASVILAVAAELDIDLIAMATHGRTGLRRWAFGSVTAKILRSTESHMLTIRPTAADFKNSQEGFKWAK